MNKTSIKIDWVDLPKPLNAFTKRSAQMRDLKHNKPIQFYAANTKIKLAQKGITEQGTFYRTQSAKDRDLDWAFEAAAFGLPNEKAPSVPSYPYPFPKKTLHLETLALPLEKKQKSDEKKNIVSSKDGEKKRYKRWLKGVFKKFGNR